MKGVLNFPSQHCCQISVSLSSTCLRNWMAELLRKFWLTESNAFILLPISQSDFLNVSSVTSHVKCTVPSTGDEAQIWNSLDISPSLNREKNWKSDKSQILIKSASLEGSSASCFSLVNWLNSHQLANQLLRSNFNPNLKDLPLTSKAASCYFGQVVRYWVKGNVPRFEKPILTSTLKASVKLPAGAGKFPPVTCRNRRQSLPAENFACICR